MEANYETELARTVEFIKGRQKVLSELPATAPGESIRQAVKQLPDALSQSGIGLSNTIDVLLNTIAPALSPGQVGPRYYGFVTGGCTTAAQLADFVTTSFDNNAQVNLPNDSISTFIEHLSCQYTMDLLLIPRNHFKGYTVVPGATSANILSIDVAREVVTRTVKGGNWSVAENGTGGVEIDILSAGAHASTKKAAAILGIGRARVQPIEDSKLGICAFDLTLLKQKLKEASESGRGAIVVASIGEVNTGGCTPDLGYVRELCDAFKAWLHIDAAFGGFASLHPDFAYLSKEFTFADSLTLDGHKWLQTPYDCALCFTKDAENLSNVCGPGKDAPAYLASGKTSGTKNEDSTEKLLCSLPSPLNTHLENSTRFRALPLYCTLTCYGKAGYEKIVRNNIDLARSLADWLQDDEHWDVLIPAKNTMENFQIMNIVLFSPSEYVCKQATTDTDSNKITTAKAVQLINLKKKMYASPTVWKGRAAIRIAVSNWLTSTDDLEIIKMELTRVGHGLLTGDVTL